MSYTIVVRPNAEGQLQVDSVGGEVPDGSRFTITGHEDEQHRQIGVTRGGTDGTTLAQANSYVAR